MTKKLSPDQLAAHDLLSELRTRIATQPLAYQYGVEARALESLWEVFGLARKAMKDHPGCAKFASETTRMLNVDLRPVTAKWHRAHQAGLLDSRDGANEFRADLAAVQAKLTTFSLRLQEIAYGTASPDEMTPGAVDDREIESCFVPVPFGIEENYPTAIANAKAINEAETNEIAARRESFNIQTAAGTNAVGLSLSGGGMRSATFCLGVVQVLVDRGLMHDFDYLSTVSGGGYTGSFISSRLGSGLPLTEIGNPHGPDTGSVRYLRQNAKYLSATDLKQRWLMVTATMAGLLLNWTAPLSILAGAAFLVNLVNAAEPWLWLTYIMAFLTAISFVAYGILLRSSVGSRIGGMVFAATAALVSASVIMFAVETVYQVLVGGIHKAWTFPGIAAASVVSGPAILRFVPLFRSPSVQRIALRVAVVAAGLVVPLVALACFYLLRMIGSLPFDPGATDLSPLHYVTGTYILIAIAVVCFVFAAFFLNINLTGPHKLYRDQLTRAFVDFGARTPTLPLSSLNSSHRAPYHLLNATLNLPSSTSPVLRERRGDFFLFSKHWSGAPAIGYLRTNRWKGTRHEIDLATAMAISGAAASPQMGLASMPALSALMTLLNVRLGFWIADPRRLVNNAPGFLCLLREMTGIAMSEKEAWFNLSDGGHIENMGIYELLRRRCKFMVCVDGEADPRSTFHGQMTLVRHAQIDFGIRIEPRLDELRPDPASKFSRSHAQMFRVHYPDEGVGRPAAMGLILYLKLSLTGDEIELLKRYRAIHPDFPHQSTIDQFYDEEQFEAYRQLGVHVAEGMFSPALMTKDRAPKDVENWFRQLAANMLEPGKA
ncbi:patatin-like phospholipase family protein [Mesorhizobium sp. CA7]|uniref:patatin-like phospholipase family protein n=1 Tax=Mesorhizobium sp. CA7 TaxID=588501 RepID=UPI001CCCE557|nr:patatin-like phospholipase family protein [Mesorhizobium sp. CA7]MBZ9814757.1 hypothetical protein [Mesorhizobium sp. CA7]